MYKHLTKLILAGVAAVILTVEPANASHKGVVHGAGGETPDAAVLRIVEPKVVFVTDGVFTGAFGGLAAADAVCQQRADNAGLGGDFMAWLSGVDSTPTTRFTTLPLGPYHMLDGRIVASNFADLLDGELNEGISITEFGTLSPGTNGIWTGTKADGSSGDSFCDAGGGDWTSAADGELGSVGNRTLPVFDWTENSQAPCNLEFHLYCFEQ